ncbi:MAG TPA: hypothetical protein VN541_24240 [Tepidisphaeraceae bacterium]|nr:hypothetical protein [Tepidisphaeraceae bacterium]
MPEVIELTPNNDADHLVEPPIIDSLIREDGRREWAIVFIPEDAVSPREKEQVTIAFDSADGRRIMLRVNRLEQLLGQRIDRIFHAGDGNFTFHSASGHSRELAQPHGKVDLSVRAYVELSDISMTAEIAFLGQVPSAR